MKTKNFLPLFIGTGLFASSQLFAQATITATTSGSWDSGPTWSTNGTPSMQDVLSINRGVTVTLEGQRETETIKSFYDSGIDGASSGYAELIINGNGITLNTTANSRFYYATRLNITVKDGATLNMGETSWGSGDGHSNITVSNATFTGSFNEQFQGSKDGSVFLIDRAGTASATGGWKMQSAATDHKMTVHIDGSGSSLSMNTHQLLLSTKGGNASGKVIVSNGGTLNMGSGELTIENAANASNSLVILGRSSSVSARTIRVGNNNANAAAENSTTKIQFGGYDSNNVFQGAKHNAIVANYEVIVKASGTIEFNLDAALAANDMKGDVVFKGQYFKQVEGMMQVDMSQVFGLAEGTYYFGLISSTQNFITGYNGADANYSFEDHINVIGLGSNMTYDGYVVADDNGNAVANEDGKKVFIKITVSNVPEPSTYAIVFGALALAFAAYRRRK